MASANKHEKSEFDQIQNCPAILTESSTQNKKEVATAEMCYYCFDVLHNYLYRTGSIMTPTFPNEKFPLFVTWKSQGSHGEAKRLRGCVGTFAAKSLHNGLKEFALTSALSDRRFSPISKKELPRLYCSISLLADFEPGNDYKDWTIGVHGIRILFLNNEGTATTATYLPEVIVEQGWDHEEAIDSLLRKGGFRGPISMLVRQSIQLTRYKSHKFTVSHEEYLKHKKCVPLAQAIPDWVTVQA